MAQTLMSQGLGPDRFDRVSKIETPSKQTQGEYAYRVVKRAIVRCKLAPGSQVTEAELMERFAIGRAAVRTALSRLYQERLVQPVPRRGYVVAPITLKLVQDLFAVRLLLEPPSVRMVAEISDAEQLEKLKRLCSTRLRTRYQLGDADGTAEFLEANTEFHVTMAQASGNERLANILASLLSEMERLFHFGLMQRDRNDEMYHEHQELVEALIRGDAELAEQLAREQIIASQKMVTDALLSNTRLQTVSLTMLPKGSSD